MPDDRVAAGSKHKQRVSHSPNKSVQFVHFDDVQGTFIRNRGGRQLISVGLDPIHDCYMMNT